MFGKNPIRKQELDPEGALWVQEIFPTIQGEGPYAGRPALFVRLGGCNLRCWFCDTDFESGTLHLSSRALAQRCIAECKTEGFEAELIVLTGGEPLRQNLVPFLEALNSYIEVQIETAGTIWVPGLERFVQGPLPDVTLVCSPKTGKVDPMIEKHCGHYKYIVSAQMPMNWAKGVPFNWTQSRPTLSSEGKAPLYFPPDPACAIWLQPCDEQDPALNASNRDLCASLVMKHGYRLSLQQHKILNLP